MLINREIIREGMSYEEYKLLIDKLDRQNKTTGNNHSEAMLKYSRLNTVRMKRIEKTFLIKPELEEMLLGIQTDQIWLVMIEAWCGDVANNLPVIAKMAEIAPKVSLRLILRDEYPAIMDEYLTDGSRSIPKLVGLKSDSLKELFTWGPRPFPAQEMVIEYKKNPGRPYAELAHDLQSWYIKDRNNLIQSEFIRLFKEKGNEAYA